MKILRTDNSHSGLLKSKESLPRGSSNKKTKAHEFRKILEKTMGDQSDDWEEFRVLLPKHGNFWDNGYEDLNKEALCLN